MRRTALALSLIALLAACGQPAETPADTAATPAPVEEPVMPADAPPQEEVPAEATPAANQVPCSTERGQAAAVQLVERCVAVSPASHPPCHPDNPCKLIQDEIDRSCALWTQRGDVPAECAA